MSRHPFSDGWKIGLSLMAGPLGVLSLVLCVVFALGRCSKPDARIEALRDTLRITDSVIVVRAETVTVRQRRVDTLRAELLRVDTLVRIIDDSTVQLKDSARNFNVPPLVIADLNHLRRTVAGQDSLIAALYGKDSTQEWRIATRDKLYRAEMQKANAPRWGVGATIGYGCTGLHCGPSLNVGVTWQAKVPSPKQVLKKLMR